MQNLPCPRSTVNGGARHGIVVGEGVWARVAALLFRLRWRLLLCDDPAFSLRKPHVAYSLY